MGGMIEASLGYSGGLKLALAVTLNAWSLLVIVFKYNTHEKEKARELGGKN